MKDYLPMHDKVEIPNGTTIDVLGIGNINLTIQLRGKSYNYILKGVRYVPDANIQLVLEITLVEDRC